MNDSDIIAEIIEREGGYADHPADHGGPTKFGITLNTLRRHDPQATAETVRGLTTKQAADIYREDYIREPGFDRIKDDDLRALVVDSAVLHGVAGATKMLQRAVGVTADGVFGILTEKAANISADEVYRSMCAERVRWYGRFVSANPDQLPFLSGWLNRISTFIEA